MEKLMKQQVGMSKIQCVFKTGYRTKDIVFVYRQLQKKYLARKNDFQFGFVDLEQPFH